MQNYALLKSMDYIDAGKTSPLKSDAAGPRNGENPEEATNANPVFPMVCDDSIAEAGLEPARALLPTGF
jgi:hypothetical protein